MTLHYIIQRDCAGALEDVVVCLKDHLLQRL